MRRVRGLKSCEILCVCLLRVAVRFSWGDSPSSGRLSSGVGVCGAWRSDGGF